MAATLTRERFAGPEWVFERKLDGIRLLAFKRGQDVELLSRNRLPQNDGHPAVAAAVRTLPQRDLVLGGEAVGVWGPRAGESAPAYHVFDVLWIDGQDLTEQTLDARRAV